MKTKVLIGMILVLGSVVWSCNDKESVLFVEEGIQLKSETFASSLLPCDPEYIPLIAGQNADIGNLIVYNDFDILRVEFQANLSHTLSEVHLWIGTEISEVPVNKNNIPIVGKFPFHAKQTSDYSFTIDLSDIDEPEVLLDGKPIYLFAHAIVVDDVTGEVETAWSAGECLSSNRWNMYTTYSCCLKSGGTSGCYPHPAMCGRIIDGEYFYDNKKAGDQIIYTENGKVAGTIIYDQGKFTFNFSQNWMFTGLLGDPIIDINGYYKPDGDATLLFSDAPPDKSYGPYTVSVSYYPYYKLKLNIQNCR